MSSADGGAGSGDGGGGISSIHTSAVCSIRLDGLNGFAKEHAPYWFKYCAKIVMHSIITCISGRP